MNIPFTKPDIGQEEVEAVTKLMLNPTVGVEVSAFEKEFAKYTNNKYAIFTNCCTSALKLSYKLLREQGFDGISYPTNTFCATYSAAAEIGLALFPDLCQNVGVKELKWQVQSNVKFIISVNGAEKRSLTGDLINLNSALVDVLTRGNEEKECLHRQSSKKVIFPPNLLFGYEQVLLTRSGIILPILGLEEIGERLPNAKCVELNLQTTQNIKDILLGQTKTLSTQEIEKTGNNYVANATSTMIIAKVNVHFGGQTDSSPCLIEDSAHRIGPNDPLVGKIRCYSFHRTKNMTCNPTGQGANGGMFVTNDKEIYERARLYWNDGTTREPGKSGYEVATMAGGYDGNDLLATVGRIQLKKLPAFIERRNNIRDYYNSALGLEWAGNHLYIYPCSGEKELTELALYLRERGIETGWHYPHTGWTNLSLPIYPSLTKEEQDYVIESINSYRRNKGI